MAINYCHLLGIPYQTGDEEFKKIFNDKDQLIDFYLCAKHKITLPSHIYVDNILISKSKRALWGANEYAFAIELLDKTIDPYRIIDSKKKITIDDLKAIVLLSLRSNRTYHPDKLDSLILLLRRFRQCQPSEIINNTNITAKEFCIVVYERIRHILYQHGFKPSPKHCIEIIRSLIEDYASYPSFVYFLLLTMIDRFHKSLNALLPTTNKDWTFSVYHQAMKVADKIPFSDSRNLCLRVLDHSTIICSLHFPEKEGTALQMACSLFSEICTYDNPKQQQARLNLLCCIAQASLWIMGKEIDVYEVIINSIKKGQPFPSDEKAKIDDIDSALAQKVKKNTTWSMQKIKALRSILIHAESNHLLLPLTLTALLNLIIEQNELNEPPEPLTTYFEFLRETGQMRPDIPKINELTNLLQSQLTNTIKTKIQKRKGWTSKDFVAHLELIECLPEYTDKSGCLRKLAYQIEHHNKTHWVKVDFYRLLLPLSETFQDKYPFFSATIKALENELKTIL